VVLKEYSRDPEQMFTCLDFGCKKIAS